MSLDFPLAIAVSVDVANVLLLVPIASNLYLTFVAHLVDSLEIVLVECVEISYGYVCEDAMFRLIFLFKSNFYVRSSWKVKMIFSSFT